MPDQNEKDYFMRRFGSLKHERVSFIEHYRELSDFMQPRRGRFLLNDRNKGDRRYSNIVNSVAVQALRTATAGLFAGAMSPNTPWFNIRPFNTDLMRSHQVATYLYKVTQLHRQILLSSNFYNMAPVALTELIMFGTSSMSHLDDFENVARFYTHTAGSYMIGQDADYRVNTFVLEKEMTVEQMVGKFGRENVSYAVRSLYDAMNYDTWMPVVQLVEPNPDYDARKLESRYKRYRSVWFEPGNVDKDMFLAKEGFNRFPTHVTRWALANEDIYGTDCPGMVALGDTKGLQIQERRKAQGVDKIVTPVMTGPTAMRNVPFRNLPGGLTLFDNEGKEGLRSAYNVNLPIAEMRQDMRDVERRINQAFFVDLFLAITNIEGVQPRNQLELAQRNQEALLQLGPPLGRIHREFLVKVIEGVHEQAIEANILPPAPPELEGQPLEIDFTSSLALAQQASEIGTIERHALFAESLAQFSPSVLDNYDADSALRLYGQGIGVTPEVTVPPEQVAEIRQQRAEQQQQQQAIENNNMQAATASQGANAVKQLAEL